MKSVAVLDTNKQPQNPVHPAVARKMMKDGKAAVYRNHPFAVILRPAGSQGTFLLDDAPQRDDVRPLRLKIDPRSRVTGLAIVDDERREILWAGELKHRGLEVRAALEHRRAMRRGRRNRHTRYRPARFDNRRKGGCHSCGRTPRKNKDLCRPCASTNRNERTRIQYDKWLAPSLMSRVYNVETWVKRLRRSFPIGNISVEVARFDTQLMENPEINGVEYQQGKLAGYELREYLLEKFERKCAYCGKTGIPLEVEHIIPKTRGGTDRAPNLTIACVDCNKKKDNKTAEEFGHPEVQKKAQMPLRDAAMMNATRYRTRDMLVETGLPVETGTGGRTKWNRTRQGLEKSHWADAACVGASTPDHFRSVPGKVYEIRARSHYPIRRRQTCKMHGKEKGGFPRDRHGKAGVRFSGYQTGDVVKVVMAKGEYAGVHRGRIAVGKYRFIFSPRRDSQPKSFSPKAVVKLLDRCGSYEYSEREISAM